MIKKDIEKILSWGRYLYWSDILRCRLTHYLENSNDVDESDGWYFYAVMSQWYASVWVVIEGWKEMKMKGDEHVFWIKVLFDEFQRFFWEWPEKITNSKKLAEEMREDIKGSIGWIPTDIFPSRKANLDKLAQEGEQLLLKYGDYENPKAVVLIDAISCLRKVIRETPDNPFLNNLDQTRLGRSV